MQNLFHLVPASAYVMGCMALAAILVAVFYGLRPQYKTARRSETYTREHDGETHEVCDPENCVKASVIVYIESRKFPIADFINDIVSQDYPDYEIIAVNDANAEATALLAEQFADNDKVYITFIPQGSHNLSRRKLALTIGMKAAKGDVVVTTSTNVSIPSNRWLSELMDPFNEDPDIDVTLGYSTMDFSEMKGFKRWYRQFDNIMTASQWIGYALMHRPYRGDGHNLAFRRHVFFEHKGYSKTINLQSGDDDLFVNEITTSDNTSVVLSPQSILTTRWGESSKRIYVDNKERYDFNSRWLPKGPFFRGGILSAMQWIVPVALGAGVWLSWPNVVAGSVALVILLMFWGMEIALYRRVAVALKGVRLWWALPVFMMWHPVGNFIFRIRHHSRRIHNFTWVREKPLLRHFHFRKKS